MPATGVGKGLGIQPLGQEQRVPQKPASGVISVSETREGVSVPASPVGTWVRSP